LSEKEVNQVNILTNSQENETSKQNSLQNNLNEGQSSVGERKTLSSISSSINTSLNLKNKKTTEAVSKRKKSFQGHIKI